MEDRILILVPTRGRPENACKLANAWEETTSGDGDSALLFVCDSDDPELQGYLDRFPLHEGNGPLSYIGVRVQEPAPRPGLAGALNMVATDFANAENPYFALANLGDDHRPRTLNWDKMWIDELKRLGGTGVVYGDDLLQGPLMATAVGLTTDIVSTLGWMTPPGLDHLYVDLAWIDLGRAIDRCTYMPETIIEHMHPSRGKAESDAGYERVNHPSMYLHDREAYLDWLDNGIKNDAANVLIHCIG